MTHDIKKGKVLPGGWRQRGKPPTYPLATLAHRDHFDTDIKEGETEQQAVKRLRTTTSTWRLKHHSSKAFTVRVVTHEETGKRVIRVWARESVPPVKREKDNRSFFRS